MKKSKNINQMTNLNLFVGISNLIATVLIALLGIFVYRNSNSAKRVSAFFLICLTSSVWVGLYGLAYLGMPKTLFLVAYIGVIFQAVVGYHFVVQFIKLDDEIKFVRGAYLIASIFTAVHFLTTNILNDFNSFEWGLYPKAGSWHPLLLIFIILIVSRFLFLLLKHYLHVKRNQSDEESQRVLYVLLGVGVFSLSAFDFAPNYGVNFVPIGSFVATAYTVLIAVGIIKYKLMDIEVVIKRAAVFAGLFAFVYGTFTIVTIIGQEFFRNTLGWNQWIAMIPTVLIITFTLRPLEIWLTNATEKWLFQKKYDYRELLRLFTNEILTVLDLQKLMEQTVAGLNNIIKVESACVLLLDKETKSFKVVAGLGIKEKGLVFSEQDILIKYLKASNQHILHDQHAEKMEEGELKNSFKKLNAKLCLPIELHDDLIGLICLGMKKSGEDYTQEDIDILMTLARTEAIAISNAQLFDELSKTQAEAAQREKMAVIGTLAAGINHEICNPLGIVRGQCEMFLLNMRDGFYEGKNKEELLRIFSEILSKVIKETDRATAITKKLSSFAKPPSKTEREEVFVEKEVDEVMSLLGHDMKLSNIDVQKDFPNNFPIILADKKQIQEVLFNIIRNGAQAMDPNKRGRIVISGFSDNDTAIVRIADNGSGIPDDKLAQIFHPFYTTKAPGKGTGLGLFIVKQVVERNQGTISVESEFGVGTTFTLRFPTALHAIAHN